MDRLVIVYSTCYRNWEAALPSQLELFEHLGGDCTGGAIVGAHYWTQKWGYDNPIQETAPHAPPADLLASFPVRSTHTLQPVGLDRVTYFMDSLRIALSNAKELYREIYGEEMPADQLAARRGSRSSWPRRQQQQQRHLGRRLTRSQRVLDAIER